MIETTLATEFIPATNLQGDMVSADWRYLLPNLNNDSVLCLGIPELANLKVLSTIGKRIFVVSMTKSLLEDFHNECQKSGLLNFDLIQVRCFDDLPFKCNCFSLIYFSNRKIIGKFLHDSDFRTDLHRYLSNNGTIFYEVFDFKERYLSKLTATALQSEGMSLPRNYWLTPLKGEMRTALPIGDGQIAHFFFRNVTFGQSFKKRTLSQIGTVFSRLRLIDKVIPRRVVFLRRGNETNAGRPPEYLLNIAGQAGLDLSDYRFGLSTRGKYNANKVIFYLFRKSEDSPEIIVKMTRAAEYNYRLENEFRGLSLLNDNKYVQQGSFPRQLFFNKHHNLAVLAQKAVPGEPFRLRTRATPDCPLALQALEWLVNLAATSVNHSLVSNREAAANLHKLFDWFNKIYALDSHEKDFLSRQLQSIESRAFQFPLVFQHGDPGTWNILVRDDAKIVFIDWEATEPHGIPLWDLFYFLRTFASWVCRKQGRKNSLQNFEESFLKPSAFSDLLLQTVRQYCSKIELDPVLIEPLFYTCWMHRALKESTRLSVNDLNNGHYFNLLRLCIANREAPTLHSLFTNNVTVAQNLEL